MFGTENLMVDIGGAKVPVAAFGKGKKNIIFLPGVGDGLTTAEGKALMFALSYHVLIKNFRVYVMSRRVPFPEHQSTKEMADDIKAVMDAIGIDKANFIGVSMGGMITQHFIASYPERTEKAVLVVTTHKKTEEMNILSEKWLALAEKADGVGLMRSSVKNMYTAEYYKKNGWLCEITGRFMMPKSYDRFIRMGYSCIEHNADELLGKIAVPVLVIGGEEDKTVGAAASYEMAKRIPNAEIFMYKGLGHGLYDEAPDFINRVVEFINK